MLAFLWRAGIFYLLWLLLYHFLLASHTLLDRFVIDNLIDIASTGLRVIGYELIPNPAENEPIRTIGIDGTHGLWVGDPCNGLTLFAVFLSFMLAIPGKFLPKIWFIPLGLLCIHLANATRIMLLTIIVEIDYNYLDFNHNYTFTIFVYGIIIGLWWWYIKKLSGWYASN